MPEVGLRDINLDQANHVRVIFIHANRPGVLRQVNSIFADHNVEKQISDSRGEVRFVFLALEHIAFPLSHSRVSLTQVESKHD